MTGPYVGHVCSGSGLLGTGPWVQGQCPVGLPPTSPCAFGSYIMMSSQRPAQCPAEGALVWCSGESGDQPVSCVERDTKAVLLREKILPARWCGVGTGKRFSLLARNGQFSLILCVPGEFCTGWALRWGLLGEFCTGWALRWVLLGEFCTGWALRWVLLGEFCTGWAMRWALPGEFCPAC